MLLVVLLPAVVVVRVLPRQQLLLLAVSVVGVKVEVDTVGVARLSSHSLLL